MIQTVLFFILGFLSAGFIALLIAPAVWRRAEILTQKRIEASIPMTRNEVQAEGDRLRAEFAMATRRLEMSVKSLREKAADQLVQIGRGEELLRQAGEEDERKAAFIADLEERAGGLQAELETVRERLQESMQRLSTTERQLAEQSQEVVRLGRMHEEASLLSSSRQIELVARESDVDRLSAELSQLRLQAKDSQRRVREVEAESRALHGSLKSERKKIADVERRLERSIAALADREADLERAEAALAAARQEEPSGSGDGEGAGKDIARLREDRERLEARLKVFTRENKKLREEIKALNAGKSEAVDADRSGAALLREEIGDIAAKVVNLTAMLEGPDSPINGMIGPGQDGSGPGEAMSLAERIRALQQASSAN